MNEGLEPQILETQPTETTSKEWTPPEKDAGPIEKLEQQAESLIAVEDSAEKQKTIERLKELTELTHELLRYEDHPNERHGLEKAKMIAEWLTEKGVRNVEIIKLDNPDESKEDFANERKYWYMVQVAIGNQEYDGNGVNGMINVHSDQVAKNPGEIKYEVHKATDGTLESVSHPWIEDNTINLAATMQSMVETQKWWDEQMVDENFAKENGTGRILFTIDGGEEMNTASMRAAAEHWRKEGKAHPMDFAVFLEATGRDPGGEKIELPNGMVLDTNMVPRIATENKGKGIYEETISSEATTVANAFRHWFARMQTAQCEAYLNSYKRDHFKDEREILGPTSAPSTIINFNQDENNVSGSVFREARTNPHFSVQETYDQIQARLDEDPREFMKSRAKTYQKLREYPELFEDYSKLNVDISNVTVSQEGNFTVLRGSNGEPYHPGKFNPFERHDGTAEAVLIMSYLTEDEANLIQTINIGHKENPNSVPADFEIKFAGDIDWEQIQQRIEDDRDNWNKNIERYIIESAYGKDYPDIQISPDPYVPARGSAKMPEQCWGLVTEAQQNVREQIAKILGVDVGDIPPGVFDAMTSVGPFTYEDNLVFWHKDPETGKPLMPVITVGVGNVGTLHSNKEALSAQELAIAVGFMQGMPQRLFMEASKQRRARLEKAA